MENDPIAFYPWKLSSEEIQALAETDPVPGSEQYNYETESH